jgi:fatty acid desaturase
MSQAASGRRARSGPAWSADRSADRSADWGAGGPTRGRRVEWPTVVLAATIYVGWLAATWWHAGLPWPLRAALGGWLLAWHGSLQHEVIHGHPTPWRRLNALIGATPLALWLPFERYQRSHLAHHATDRVTEPGADPETRYLRAPTTRLARVGVLLARLQATLLGRMVLGPFVDLGRFVGAEAAAFAEAPGNSLKLWGVHALTAAPVLVWLLVVCRISLLDYGLTFVLPGAALTLVRSFAEHRADPVPARRVAVVERAPVLGLLFLNNNLHAAHHAWPGVAWFRLPELYRRKREAVLSGNGGLVYDGYREVFARYLFRRHDDPVHPALAAERAPGEPLRSRR